MHHKTLLPLFILILMPTQLILAHGDAHKEGNHSSIQMEETPPINSSIYSIKGEENELPILKDSHINLPFSNNAIFDDAIPSNDKSMSSDEPMQRFKAENNPSKNHSQHEKQQVEEATHKLVLFDAKGYKVAIGVTIFSGLTFIGLSLFRTGEGNEKNVS